MNAGILNKLKSKSELIPEQHDGSYELVQAIVNSYRHADKSVLDFNDLNAVYLMAIGTWKHGVSAKKKALDKSHLPSNEKTSLKKLLDEVEVRALDNKYSNHHNTDVGTFGMFGTGIFSFQTKTNKESVEAFVKLCVDIIDMDDDEKMFTRAEMVLTPKFKGMRAASASIILHCLKPYSFPVLNSNMGSEDIFGALGITLHRRGDIDTYIQNCRAIKAFRDANLPFRNYRILDMAAWELGTDSDPITEIIKQYKLDFVTRDKQERYKWVAVKCFQDNWNIDAPDFPEMLGRALARASVLLTTGQVFATKMIVLLARKQPERVRQMFARLYEEDTNPVERIDDFMASIKQLFKELQDSNIIKEAQHFQSINAISTYLFFRYPEKYYIYKHSKYQVFAEKIGFEAVINTGVTENIAGYFNMCDLVLSRVKEDTELQAMSQGRLTPDCYDDPALHLLADDVVYFGSRSNSTAAETDGEDDTPEEEVNEVAVYQDKNIILYGPPGTGKTYRTVKYAVAIIEGRPLRDIENESYNAILERYNRYKDAGSIEFITFHQSYGYEEFIEGIKPVPQEDGLDNTKSISYEVTDGVFKAFCDKAQTPIIKSNNDFGFSKTPTVWKVSLAGTGDNPVRQDCMQSNYIRIGWDEYGDQITDETVFDIGGKTVLNAFINKMQIGDIVLSCYSERSIDAVGVVKGDYEWHEELSDYKRVRKVDWLIKGINYDIYELNKNTLMTLSTVYRLNMSVADVMKILQDNNHQVISHEERGSHVFIIDEINRGNISKIFGELITLIEPSKRLGQPEAIKAKLPYSKTMFGVPGNVYIVGTMNTADRSIALLDTALRRRFTFVECQPDIEVLQGIEVDGVSIPNLLQKINSRIEVLVDREHVIGHSFFLPLRDNPSLNVLASIFRLKVIPLLQEYFYDDYEKIRLVLGDNSKQPDEQFIQQKTIRQDLFGGAEIDIDELASYEINNAAFSNINAYRNL